MTSPADNIAVELGNTSPVQLIADAGGGTPAGGNAPSGPQTLRQAIQRILFEITFWIPERVPGQSAADTVDTVLGHAARAAGFGRACWTQLLANTSQLATIGAKLDALTQAVAALTPAMPPIPVPTGTSAQTGGN